MPRITSWLSKPLAALVVAIMMVASVIIPAFATDDATVTTEVATVVEAPAPAAEAPAESEESAAEASVAEVVEPTDSAPADAAEPAAEAPVVEAPAPVEAVEPAADAPAEAVEPAAPAPAEEVAPAAEAPVVDAVEPVAVAADPIERDYTASCSVDAGTYTVTYSPSFNPGTSGAYVMLQPAGEGNSQDSAIPFGGSNSITFTLDQFVGTTVGTQGVIEIQTFYPNGGGGLEFTGPYLQVDLSGCTDVTPPPPVTVFIEAPVVNCVAGPSNDNVVLPNAPEGVTVSISSEWAPAPQGESTKTVTVVLDLNTVHGEGSYTGGLVYDNSGNCGQDVEIVLVPIPDMSGVIDACNPAGVVSNIIWTEELPPSDNFVLNTESADGTRTSSLKDTSFTTWTDGTVAPKVYADSGVVCEGEGLIVVTAVDGTFIDEPGSQFNLRFVPPTTEGLEYVQIKLGNTITVVAVVTDSDKYVQGNPEWFQIATDMLVPIVEDPEVPVVDPKVPDVDVPEVPVVDVKKPAVNAPKQPVVATPAPLANPGLPDTGADGPATAIPPWIVAFLGATILVAATKMASRRPVRAAARRSMTK